MKTRPKYRICDTYSREIYMSEYVSIPKAKYRRMVVSEVISWGISVFLILVMVLR